MSPAAQRLANATLGLSGSDNKGKKGAKSSSFLMDPELRKAYSPSPAATAAARSGKDLPTPARMVCVRTFVCWFAPPFFPLRLLGCGLRRISLHQ